MRAVILAAGRGIRMGSLTRERPKCMIELAGRSVLARQIEVLRQVGCRTITIVAGHGAEAIPELGIERIYNRDYATTNMVATFFCARTLMTGTEDLIVSYGDIVYEERIVRALTACRAPVCLSVDVAWRHYWERRMPNPLSDAETLKLDAAGRVLELGQKTDRYDDIQGQYMGLFKLRADWLERLPKIYDEMPRDRTYDGKDFPNMYMTSFLQHLIGAGWHVQSVPVRNGWLEIDTMDDLRLYTSLHEGGRLDEFCKLA